MKKQNNNQKIANQEILDQAVLDQVVLDQEILNQWNKDEKESFKGWDFSYLDGRWTSEETLWNYTEVIKEHLKEDHVLLDMGTGGGEFLLSLNHPYDKTYVTEAWEPNIKLCLERLEPLGITVKAVVDKDDYPNTTLLPFEDDFFDIIINRHESYNPSEVKRILKPNGLFITQQVGGMNNNGLSKMLLDNFVAPYPDIVLSNAVRDLKTLDFKIKYEMQCFPKLSFYDVGAIVFFAKIIEWEFPGFSVDRCKDKLLEIHKQILKDGTYESIEHRYMIVAQK